jgi:hypothetical protein
MRFFQVVLSGAAIIAAAWALELNEVPSSIEPGKTYTITYSPKDDTPTTFTLRKGNPGNLDDVDVLTTSATGGSFEWTVDDSLPNADDYAIMVSQGSVENYSGQIKLTGSDAEPSSSGSATPSASATPSSTGAKSSTDASATATETETETTLATTAAASATVTSTVGSNSTISSATLSRTGSGTSAPASTTTGSSSPPQETNAASMLGSSPLALIFGAIAAMAYF